MRHFDLRLFRNPKFRCEMGEFGSAKNPMKTEAATCLPKHPKSTGSEKSAARRTEFGPLAGAAVNSPAATTLENNDKLRRVV